MQGQVTPDAVWKVYKATLGTPLMKWFLWISVAIVIAVPLIARRKGLSMVAWFLYALFLGPIALAHVLAKQKHDPGT
jgi:hypothetical protein